MISPTFPTAMTNHGLKLSLAQIIGGVAALALVVWVGPRIYDEFRLIWDKAEANSIDIEIRLGWGLLSRDLSLTNNDNVGDLTEVRVEIDTFPYGSDFHRPDHKQTHYFDAWRKGETKIVSVPAGGYNTILITGDATAGRRRVNISKSASWKRTLHGGMTAD
jgi:hypothetical protein